MKKKVYVVDVSSLFFRAYYAIRNLSSPSGLPTNAIYGFLNMILKLMKDEKPEYMVFCYDRKEASFRKDIYPDYKANRSETPEDLIPQIPYIKSLAPLLGVSALEVSKYEADDLIGTIVALAKENGFQSCIVSGDKDFAQLVDQDVVIYDTMKAIVYDEKGVLEKWGVPPHQFIDYLSLIGDSSDNIPGVQGIGAKGAQKLLQEFQSLDGIYERIEEVKSKSLKEKLINGKEFAFLSKELVKIFCQVNIEKDIESYRLKGMNVPGLMQLIEELNFKSLENTILSLRKKEMSLLGQSDPLPSEKTAESEVKIETPIDESGEQSGEQKTEQESEPPTNLITNEQIEPSEPSEGQSSIYEVKEIKAQDFGQIFKENQILWGLTLLDKTIIVEEIDSQPSLSTGLSQEPSPAYKIYFIQKEVSLEKMNESESKTLELDSSLGLVADSLKIQWKGFDLKTFWHSIACSNPLLNWDSMLAAYLIHAGEVSQFHRVYERETGKRFIENPSLADFFMMNLQLETNLLRKIKEIKAEDLLYSVEFPLVSILFEMENRGIYLDADLLMKQNEELTFELKNLEVEIFNEAGENFNVASPKQLAHILFEKLQLPPIKKIKTGYSTDNDVLEKLENKHPIISKVLIHREISKLKSTYVEALPKMRREDGRIHTTFKQALTTTGRLSSVEPNLQNIPIRSEKGSKIRRAFIAKPGQFFLSADYSQIELRVLAHISKDPNLVKFFNEDLDIHAMTAAEVFNKPLAEVTSDMRRTAKAVNFGIAYGQGPFGLAESLRISRSEAQDIIKKYFEKFPGVKNYIEDIVELAKSQGYVETLYGRRRYIEELKSNSGMIRKFGERAAINAPIQGTASDIVKKAMVEVKKEVPLPLLLQIHDELIFEGDLEFVKKWEAKIIHIMENIVSLNVPLKVNFGVGKNWEEAH